MKPLSVAIAMPAFKEAEALRQYASELRLELSVFDLHLVLVDDCSPDDTSEVATAAGFHVSRNAENLGHGPSYLRALNLALESDAEFILMTDGDGQLSGKDARALLQAASEEKVDVLRGVRVDRLEPAYRRLTSLAVKVLIFLRFGLLIQDVNTPHRVFTRKAAFVYLMSVSSNSRIPNVLGSVALAKQHDLPIADAPILFRDRLGSDPQGVSWGPAKGVLPTKKFIKFLFSALKEFAKYRPGI